MIRLGQIQENLVRPRVKVLSLHRHWGSHLTAKFKVTVKPRKAQHQTQGRRLLTNLGQMYFSKKECVPFSGLSDPAVW